MTVVDSDPNRRDEDEERPEDLTDEIAKKYDPERLLKVVAKRSGGGTPL